MPEKGYCDKDMPRTHRIIDLDFDGVEKLLMDHLTMLYPDARRIEIYSYDKKDEKHVNIRVKLICGTD